MIEIVDYRKVEALPGKVSYLKGFVKIRMNTEFGMLEFRDLQLFAKNGHTWINFPYKYNEASETNKYHYYCSFGMGDKKVFEEAVVNALRDWAIKKKASDQAESEKTLQESNKGPLSMDPLLSRKLEQKDQSA